MRIYFLALTTFLINCSVFAQNEHLFRIVEEGRFGFINAKGKTIIPPRFRYVGDFYSGLAAARLDSGYGFINQKGQFVLKPIFDFADDFIDTTAFVVLLGEKYFINKTGKKRPFSDEEYELIKTNYKNTYASCDESHVFMEVMRIGNEYLLQIINKNLDDTIYTNYEEVEETYKEYYGYSGNKRFVFKKELMLVVKGGRLCYVDTNGTVVWQAKSLHEKKLHKLNLDFRTALARNCMMFPAKMGKFEGNVFSLNTNGLVAKVFPDELAPISDSLIGMKVRLINNSFYPEDTTYFRDAYLFWNLEMKTKEGNWIPFESRCGNICITVFRPKNQAIDTLIKFPPKHYYTFTLPTYEGTHSGIFRYRFDSHF